MHSLSIYLSIYLSISIYIYTSLYTYIQIYMNVVAHKCTYTQLDDAHCHRYHGRNCRDAHAEVRTECCQLVSCTSISWGEERSISSHAFQTAIWNWVSTWKPSSSYSISRYFKELPWHVCIRLFPLPDFYLAKHEKFVGLTMSGGKSFGTIIICHDNKTSPIRFPSDSCGLPSERELVETSDPVFR